MIIQNSRFRPKSKRESGGFTVIELLLVVVIVGLIMSSAVPAFTDFIGSAKFSRTGDSLRNTIETARNAALNYGYKTVVCASTNPESENPGCRASSTTDWGDGWIAFVDCDDDGILDITNECDFDTNPAVKEAPELVIKAQSDIDEALTTGANSKIVFDTIGRTENSVQFTLVGHNYTKTETYQVSKFGNVTKYTP